MSRGAARPFRIGVVGCGFAARDRHLPALARVDAARVVAVADPDSGAAARVARGFGIERRYAEATALIAGERLDCVAVCTPAREHAPVAHAALDAGLHVLVEKPLALELDAAERLVTSARARAQTAATGFNLRSHRLVRTTRELVACGALGEIEAIDGTFSDPLLTRRVPPWRTRRVDGGGALWDKAVHHVDLWRHLLGDEVAEVTALTRSGRADDEVVALTARMSRGAIATVVASDTGPVRHELSVRGAAAAIDLDLYRFDGLAVRPATELPGGARGRLRRAAALLADPRGSARAALRGGDYLGSYERQWRDFIAAARAGGRPTAGFADGLAAVAVVAAASRAAASSRTLSV